MTYGSLFSGCAGACQGFEGYRKLWFCEWDKHCRAVLRYRYPEIPIYGDVAQFPADDVDAPDVLWMSPPCQDLSVAGDRGGLDGSKSKYFFDAIGVVRRLRERTGRPGLVLMEQVPGLRSSRKGEDFRRVLQEFRELGADEVGWATLDSQYFGVAQRRKRLFFVADFGTGCAGAILDFAGSVSGGIGPRPSNVQVSPTLSASGAGTGRTGNARTESDFLIAEVYNMRRDMTAKDGGNFSVTPCVTSVALQALQPGINSHQSQMLVAEAPNYRVRRLTPRECERLQGFDDDYTRWGRDDNGDVYELPDSARYRMCGNAVTRTVSAFIATQVEFSDWAKEVA